MGKKEASWLNEVERKVFNELADFGESRFHQLDAVLAAALLQLKDLPKQLGMRTHRTGRQLVHMVYDWFRADRHMSQVFGFADLNDTQWR